MPVYFQGNEYDPAAFVGLGWRGRLVILASKIIGALQRLCDRLVFDLVTRQANVPNLESLKQVVGLDVINEAVKSRLDEISGPDPAPRPNYRTRAKMRGERNQFRVGAYAMGSKMARYSMKRKQKNVFEGFFPVFDDGKR